MTGGVCVRLGPSGGFSLLELLMAMAVSGLVTAAIVVVYTHQQKAYASHDLLASMQQNLRTALFHLERDLRMAGYNPTEKAADAGFVSISGNALGDAVSFSMDDNNNGNTRTPDGDTDDSNERIRYALGDDDGDGDPDLERNGWLVAENMEALGLAYACDADGDGRLDWVDKNQNGQPDPEETIWAVDSDADGLVDSDLDANGDGVIDEHDDAHDGRADGKISGRPLPDGVEVSMDRIRAVRIWLLARTSRPVQGPHGAGGTAGGPAYVVGSRVIRPSAGSGSGYARRLAVTTVICRNPRE